MKVNCSSSRLLSAIVLSTLLLSACGTESANNVIAPTQQPTSDPAPIETIQPTPTADPSAELISGLTGLPVSEDSLPRPLAVMINNAPAARPQSGVSEADILYEILAEGGITRLIGIFQSHTGVVKIGPIRSIRPYLLDIGESYGGVTVHAGGSPAAYAILQKEKKQIWTKSVVPEPISGGTKHVKPLIISTVMQRSFGKVPRSWVMRKV